MVTSFFTVSLPLLTFILIFYVQLCCCANILMLSTVPSVSHCLWNQKLAKLLAERNHQVTILDSGRSMIPHPNVTHINLNLKFKILNIDLNYFSQKTSPIFAMDNGLEWTHSTCDEMLKLPKTKLFLNENISEKKKNRPFDLIIIDGACCESFLGFVEMFGSPPLIVATAFGKSTYLMTFAGIYDNPAYVPYTATTFTSDMNFLERLQNTLIYMYHYYIYHRHLQGQNRMAQEFFGPTISNVRDLSGSAVITLLNYHPAFDGVKLFPANIIPIGGFHIDPPKPLEKDLQSFLDNSKNGAIYFSFGSNLKCTDMDEIKFNIFLKTFQEIKQNIIWKCEKNFSNLPNNIYLGSWFSQNDVLAHPNVKVFISHGGFLGTQEAIYNGVPILVMPFVLDQHYIAGKLVKMGLAVQLIYSDLTVDTLKSAINKLLIDNSFQNKMNEISTAFRDNPISPRDLTIYWIEYVLRHPETVNLLRSPTQKLSIYQLLLLDVIIFLIIVTVVIIKILKILCKKLFNFSKIIKKKEKTS